MRRLITVVGVLALTLVSWRSADASHGYGGAVYYNGQLLNGVSANGTLNTAGDSTTNSEYDFWYIDVTAGVPVSVTVNRGNSGNLSPNLVAFATTASEGSDVSDLGSRIPGTFTSNSGSSSVTMSFTPSFTGLGTVVVSTYNKENGSYSISATGINNPNDIPMAVAGAGPDSLDFYEVECDGRPGGELVTLDGSTSTDPDGDNSLEYEWAAASSILIDDATAATTLAEFPVGTHEVTLRVYDLDENGARRGTFDVAYLTVEVYDDTAPVVEMFSTDIGTIWPPNHQMVPVTICLVASDQCVDPENLLILVEVSSSQPDDTEGTGEHIGDVDGEDGFIAPVPVTLNHTGEGVYEATVLLRAERDGADKAGRSYSISAAVMDGAGNGVYADTVVVVPHSRGKKK